MSSTSVLTSMPEDVFIHHDRITIRMTDGSEVSADLAKYDGLRNATHQQLLHWEWTGARSGIHWPEIDEDLSVHSMVRDTLQRRDPISSVPFLVADLLRTTAALNRVFPGRKFTPDGHLVGSIGEVVARYIYDLELEPSSNPGFDATTPELKTVEIKLAGERTLSFSLYQSGEDDAVTPDLLIALQFTSRGFTEIYNGEFPRDLLIGRKAQKNGQIRLNLKTLQDRNPRTLPQLRSLSEFNRRFDFEFDSAA